MLALLAVVIVVKVFANLNNYGIDIPEDRHMDIRVRRNIHNDNDFDREFEKNTIYNDNNDFQSINLKADGLYGNEIRENNNKFQTDEELDKNIVNINNNDDFRPTNYEDFDENAIFIKNLYLYTQHLLNSELRDINEDTDEIKSKRYEYRDQENTNVIDKYMEQKTEGNNADSKEPVTTDVKEKDDHNSGEKSVVNGRKFNEIVDDEYKKQAHNKYDVKIPEYEAVDAKTVTQNGKINSVRKNSLKRTKRQYSNTHYSNIYRPYVSTKISYEPNNNRRQNLTFYPYNNTYSTTSNYYISNGDAPIQNSSGYINYNIYKNYSMPINQYYNTIRPYNYTIYTPYNITYTTNNNSFGHNYNHTKYPGQNNNTFGYYNNYNNAGVYNYTYGPNYNKSSPYYNSYGTLVNRLHNYTVGDTKNINYSYTTTKYNGYVPYNNSNAFNMNNNIYHNNITANNNYNNGPMNYNVVGQNRINNTHFNNPYHIYVAYNNSYGLNSNNNVQYNNNFTANNNFGSMGYYKPNPYNNNSSLNYNNVPFINNYTLNNTNYGTNNNNNYKPNPDNNNSGLYYNNVPYNNNYANNTNYGTNNNYDNNNNNWNSNNNYNNTNKRMTTTTGIPIVESCFLCQALGCPTSYKRVGLNCVKDYDDYEDNNNL